MNLLETLPELLRARRKDLGLNQGAIAKALGVSIQQVSRYESGESDIPAARLGKLLAYLGYRSSDLGNLGADLQRFTDAKGAPQDMPEWASIALTELEDHNEEETGLSLEERLHRLEKELSALKNAAGRPKP